MSQTLTLELSEKAFAALQRQAAAAGTSAARVAADSLEQQFGALQEVGATRTEAEKRVARERFERHFGEIDLGHPTGADNESIDADLAREYASNHEAD